MYIFAFLRKHILNHCMVVQLVNVLTLTLFLPGEGGISPLIVYHVTKSVRNRVKSDAKNPDFQANYELY